jgi:hypothetical protein
MSEAIASQAHIKQRDAPDVRAVRCSSQRIPFDIWEDAMPKAIRFYRPGGPEVLVWEEVPVGKPGPLEARVRHTAVGLNFVDVYIRRGLYPVPLPSGLGRGRWRG